MTVDHRHYGGGCEAIVRQVGNEIKDFDVHIYYCENAPAYLVTSPSGRQSKACELHAMQWEERFKATIEPLREAWGE